MRHVLAKLSGNPQELKILSDASLTIGGVTHPGSSIHERVLWNSQDGETV